MKKNIGVVLFLSFIIFGCKLNKEKTNNQEETKTPFQNKEVQTTKSELDTSPSEVKEKDTANSQDTIHQDKKVDHYICFTENKNKNLVIWMSFNANNKALQVKYKGQKEAINLQFVKKEVQTPGYPAMNFYYNEIYEGKVNGQYIHTHSGTWDYVEYIRKDRKKFNFTINHNATPYGKTPCFDEHNKPSSLSLQTSSKISLDSEACGKIRFALKKSDLSEFKAIIVSATNGEAMVMINNKKILFKNGKETTKNQKIRTYENEAYQLVLKFTSLVNNSGLQDHIGSIMIRKKDAATEVNYNVVGAGGC